MKRDLDLVRAILLAVHNSEHEYVEEKELARKLVHSSESSWTFAQLEAHIRLMVEFGLVANRPFSIGGVSDERLLHYYVRLTWQGHDFIANASHENVWIEVKKKAGDFSFDLLKKVLFEKARDLMEELSVLSALRARAQEENEGPQSP